MSYYIPVISSHEKEAEEDAEVLDPAEQLIVIRKFVIDKLKDFRGRLALQHEVLDRLQTESAQHKMTVAQNEKQKLEQGNALTQMKKELDGQMRLIQDVVKKSTDAETHFQKITKDLSNVTTELENVKKQYAQCQYTIDQMRKVTAEQKTQLETFKKEIGEHQELLRAWQDKFEETDTEVKTPVRARTKRSTPTMTISDTTLPQATSTPVAVKRYKRTGPCESFEQLDPKFANILQQFIPPSIDNREKLNEPQLAYFHWMVQQMKIKGNCKLK